jgi:hypothetical protein
MALSILDGNQSATTLSTILSSGQHITAHTVISLGTQAITDMRGAVSGSVVSISNLPATQTIAGTVTVGNIQGYQHTTAGTSGPYNADVILVGEDIESSKAGGLVVIPAARDGGVLGGRTSQGDAPICVYGDNGSAVTISGSVTIGAGTAQIGSVTASISGTVPISISSVTVGNSVTIASLPALVAGIAQIGSVTASISGTVPISISSVTVGNSVTIGSLPAISGTVTANSSNGSLTTRFGSVTTANTAFATSAVTNANRKYLLIQNVTTASNAITVGIGFTPTTTQGIQLSSGAGLTFEGSYIPTGAVNLLSSVTASCFTILEA